LSLSVSDFPQWDTPVGRPVCIRRNASTLVACLEKTASGCCARIVSDSGSQWLGEPTPQQSIAFSSDGALLLAGSQCWSSDNADWLPVDATLTGSVELTAGGRMVETAMFGWTAAGQRSGDGPAELWLRTSPDVGATWYDFKQDLLPSQNPEIQSLLYWRGMLIAIAWGRESDGQRNALQCVGRHGRLPLTPAATNISGDHGAQLDLAYNPRSSRFEILSLQQDGGRAAIRQWSLAPHEMTAGGADWQDDGEIWSSEAHDAVLGHSAVDENSSARYVPLVLDGRLVLLGLSL
jgi:hypothetical protein